MTEGACDTEDDFEPEAFGVVCGEDLDAVLAGDCASIRAWAIGVLSTALARVVAWGAEADDLLRLSIEVLWQYSGGEVSGSEETALAHWLDSEHRRGRQWSMFAELVPAFVNDMNAMWASRGAMQELKPISDDELPF